MLPALRQAQRALAAALCGSGSGPHAGQSAGGRSPASTWAGLPDPSAWLPDKLAGVGASWRRSGQRPAAPLRPFPVTQQRSVGDAVPRPAYVGAGGNKMPAISKQPEIQRSPEVSGPGVVYTRGNTAPLLLRAGPGLPRRGSARSAPHPGRGLSPTALCLPPGCRAAPACGRWAPWRRAPCSMPCSWWRRA